MNAGDIDITLPCGIRVLVVSLPDGIGSGKRHQGEYLWSVEAGAMMYARGYCADLAEAKRKALRAARIVLADSRAALADLEQQP